MTTDLTGASTAGRPTAPDTGAGTDTDTERILAEVLADLLSTDQVRPDGHFFDDLGADSLVMAHFCARIRKRGDLPPVTIRDVYRHPTIRQLAAALPASTPATEPPATPVSSALATSTSAGEPPSTSAAAAPIRTWQYVSCGALQAVAVLAYAFLAALVVVAGYEWIVAGSGPVESYLRTALVGAGVFVGLCVIPIVVKWLLVGRWQRTRIRLWSLAYVRFWIVKTLIQRSPAVLLVGTPLYALYLRALGAKVGRRVLLLSRRVPVCTDLLTVGDGTVIRKDTFFTCYRGEAGGYLQTGRVDLGADVVVGEAAVLDIDTAMGDGAVLGHASSLQAGQSVPGGEHRHGYAAQEPTETDYRRAEPIDSGRLRPVGYVVAQLFGLLAVRMPLAIGAAALLVSQLPPLAALVGSGSGAYTGWTFYRDALLASFVLFTGSLLIGLLVVMSVPRALNLLLEPDRTYRLYGLRYGVHRAIERLTNVPFFPRLLGDSSYVVPYLRWLGYDLSHVVQTGSNFGLEVKHDNPFLCRIGSGTMVADGLSMINADFSSTSFRLARAEIGPRNFLGNYIAYPARGRTGDNCLIGTKAMVPLDGEVRTGVGLLGSPSFEIPRSVRRDARFDHLQHGAEFRRRLAAKNRHNAATIGLYLVAWLGFWFGATVLAGIGSDLYSEIGAAAIAAAGVAILVFRVIHFTLVERLSTLFRDLRPLYCSIYERDFWRHERFWKLSWQPLLLDGTPFKSLVWRLLGVRIGRRVFDDGSAIVEKTLVTVGDDCVLNVRSIVQAHSQEDGTFKSDHITIGAGCAVGVGALVHYGVSMGDGAVVAPDSFVMKGADVPAATHWGGNPARELEGSRR